MVQDLFKQNVFLYVMLGFLGVGVLMKFFVGLIYRSLVRASDNMGNSKNKLMKSVKMKFEACYKLHIGVNNVDTFVDKYIYQYRFCGIHLYTFENFSGQVVMLCLLTGAIAGGLGLIYNCGQNEILYTFFAGILCSALLIVLESMLNLPAKRKIVRIQMKDYLENLLKVRLEQEYFHPEQLSKYRQEYFLDPMEQIKNELMKDEKFSECDIKISDIPEEKIEELMDNLVDMAAAKEEIQEKLSAPPNAKVKKKATKAENDQKKEEQIIEDVLREFMA